MQGARLKEIRIGNIAVGGKNPPLIIAGPCVIEDENVTYRTAEGLKAICNSVGLPFIFKCSFDKANRTSVTSFRGPGLMAGLELLSEIGGKLDVPVISDVHSIEQIQPAADALDMIQIPAFLCRQTDLLVAASKTGKPVNVKKGQFLAPWDVQNIISKFISAGNENLMLTERGTSFGYNNLVVDFRSFPIMRSYGYPVIFDVTHSLQLPGGQGGCSGGQSEYALPLARAAAAAGVDGFFMEVHPDPAKALCDGPNMIRLDEIEKLLLEIKKISAIISR
jgi:2-dehydro-3-deoxyphosphooctonate aldolase (KDO 8-P synthase)